MDARDVESEIVLAGKLRERGASVREVAAELRVSVSTAHSRIRAWADAEVVTGSLEDRRPARIREAAALDELDAQLAAYMATAADPNPTARTRLLVSAARRKLLGLDAPSRLEIVEHRAPEPDPEVVAAVREAQERNARERAALTGNTPEPADSPETDEDST